MVFTTTSDSCPAPLVPTTDASGPSSGSTPLETTGRREQRDERKEGEDGKTTRTAPKIRDKSIVPANVSVPPVIHPRIQDTHIHIHHSVQHRTSHRRAAASAALLREPSAQVQRRRVVSDPSSSASTRASLNG